MDYYFNNFQILNYNREFTFASFIFVLRVNPVLFIWSRLLNFADSGFGECGYCY